MSLDLTVGRGPVLVLVAGRGVLTAAPLPAPVDGVVLTELGDFLTLETGDLLAA